MSLRMTPLLMAATAAVVVAGAAQAVELKQIGTIPIMLEAPLQAFDIGWYDPDSNLYVLNSFGTFPGAPDPNAFPGNRALLIFDAKTDKLIKVVKGFTRPRGVVTVNHGTQAYIGDADNHVKVVDLKAGKIIDEIQANAKDGGVDEIAYDPKDGVVAAAQPDDSPPSLILISTKTHKIFAKVTVADATDGFEQTIYSRIDGNFHTVIPELKGNGDHSGMITVNPKTGKQVGEIAPIENCHPHGNGVGVGSELIIGCNYGQTKDKHPPVQMIFDVKLGKVTYIIPGIGGTDMAEADRGLGLYYTASAGNGEGPALGVIDAKTHKLIQKVPTAGRAHSVAVNSKNHHVYVPESALQGGCGCIRVFAPS
jgi:DNA-binding beta-propeller fold protein YncE